MNKKLSILLCLFCFACSGSGSSAIPAKSSHVILMAGQSNMMGYSGEPIDTEQPTNCSFYNRGDIFPDMFGPEIGLMTTLGGQDRQYIIIKYAKGGSPIAEWLPENGMWYPVFLDAIWNTLVRADNYEIVALLWMQGESDCYSPETAYAYYDRFTAFINAMRTDLGAPDLPVIYGLINPWDFEYVDVVRDAQVMVNADVPNTVLIDTDTLTKRTDNVHYDTEGLLRLGEMFGEAIRVE